jgi:hypothetical protein
MKGVYENPAESESDSDIGGQPDIEPEAEDPIQTNEGNNTINSNKSNANELALNIEMDPTYSCLINAINQLPDTQIKQLIGDLVRIQRSRLKNNLIEQPLINDVESNVANNKRKRQKTKPKKVSVFHFTQGEQLYGAVPIPHHLSEKAFSGYQYHTPYLKEIVHELGKSKSSDKVLPEVGAKRLLTHLAKLFGTEYVEVAKEAGLHVSGTIDAVSLAAWIEDAGLKDWQAIRSLKHLRASLGSKVSVAFLEIKKFTEGYTEPKTKKFEHQYPDGSIETITCEYINVAQEYAHVVGEMLNRMKTTPADVLSLDMLLGGDHGKEAFRFCFRVVVTLVDGTVEYADAPGTATVFGRKDTREVLEKTILDWLTADLQNIDGSKLLISKDDSGKMVCGFVTDVSELLYSADSHVVPNVTIYNCGDLK